MPKLTEHPTVALSRLKLDKKLKNLVPQPSGKDRAALKAGLEAKGQEKPVTVLPNWTLVDGYTRYALLKELGVKKIKYEVVDGFATESDLHVYALSINLERRHLEDYQRGKLILKRRKLVERVESEAAARRRAGSAKGGARGKGKPKPRRGKNKKQKQVQDARPEPVRPRKPAAPQSRDELAKAGGMKSGKQLNKIATILEKGTPEQQDRADSGKSSINQVYNEIRREENAKEAAEKAAKLRAKDLGGKVIHGNAFKMKIQNPGTVDLVTVDPPYGISQSGKGTKRDGAMVSVSDALSEWGLAEGAAMIGDCLALIDKLLREGGSFYLFLDRLLVTTAWDASLQLGLKPRNTVYWGKTNPTPSGRGNWSSAVEVMLYGVKPGGKHTWNLSGHAPNLIETPVVAGRERVDHPTQKPVKLYERLMEASSNPGDLVCDFMAGSGTCGVVAKKLKRRFVLVEKSRKNVNIIKTRLAGKRG